mgnify:CR=1 FL=1
MLSRPPFEISVFPRETWTWEEFYAKAPPFSIALDGMVRGGPKFNPAACCLNFDHHDGVVREATMSTAMQIYFAIKGGLMKLLAKNSIIHVFINDTDQDTSLAVWLLLNHKLFEETQSVPHISRLLALTDRLDITGGAFPMNLSDELLQHHNWIFEPYSRLRKTGVLAQATAEVLLDNLETVLSRLNLFLMNESGKTPLDTRHTILFDSPEFKMIDEIGGNEARYFLFSHGMDAFVSLVARRTDGRFVYTIGRRSRYIPFPVVELYNAFNKAEGLTLENGWNGSDIVGGSSRSFGSKLTWQEIRDIILCYRDDRI